MGHAVFLGMTIHPLEGTKKQAKWDPFCRLYSSCFQTYASRPGPNVRASAVWGTPERIVCQIGGTLRNRVHGHGTAATTVTGDGLSK